MPARSLRQRWPGVTLGMLVVTFPANRASLQTASESVLHRRRDCDGVLLLFGALHSLRARPRAAPVMLCGASGVDGRNGWRATFDRWSHRCRRRYGSIERSAELAVVACAPWRCRRLLCALDFYRSQIRTGGIARGNTR